ncbi:beta-ketoacyl-ACP synthase II [Streptomyces sp. NPDC099088]|uniref:beta-ketoacyl-ACP synthase II n=1 Tax=Streptomyces sp. NPDC099088 TaxID=3366101 RepID=UPI003822CEDA
MSSERHVLVTGLGPVTPIGIGEKYFIDAQTQGVRGIRSITRFDASHLPSRIAGEVDLPAELLRPRRELALTDRCTHLLAAAASLAIGDAGLEIASEDRDRIGVSIGTGLGGMTSLEDAVISASSKQGSRRMSPLQVPKAMFNNAAGSLSKIYDITGPATTIVSACASGADALVAAFQMISSGEADVVLAGGSDAPVTPTALAGFAAMRALSLRNDDPPGASRPFSADRDGFVIAEGAGVLVLESAAHARARGAHVYAEFSGYGRTSDAYHLVAPHPEGAGAKGAMLKALQYARINLQDVDYINAHGTATQLNDRTEAQAVRTAFGRYATDIAVSSTKSLMGHSLGASGAIEAIATVQAINYQVAPPTANLDTPDVSLGLDIVSREARDMTINAAISNSFAFGGHNVVLAFTKPLKRHEHYGVL